MNKYKDLNAWKTSDLDPVSKLVWYCYWDHQNDKGIAWVGNDTLQAFTQSSRSSVIRAKRKLEDLGWLIPISTKKGGRAGSIRYRVTVTRGGVTQTPLAVSHRHPNYPNGTNLIPIPPICPPSEEAVTTEEVWKRANEIRKNQLGPDTRELKLKTWKAEFSKSLKRAEDPEHWLGIWEMYWTHPAFAWWRNTPQLPHAAFFRAKNWAIWEDAYDEMKHKGVLAQEQETSTNRQNTDTPGLAKIWWRKNQIEAQRAMNENRFDVWLDSAVSNPDMVREVAGIRRAAK